MNRVIFEAYVEIQLAPALKPGDVVILDNLSSHKSERAEKAIRAQGAWLLLLPPTARTSVPLKWRSQSSKPVYMSGLPDDRRSLQGYRQHLRHLLNASVLKLLQCCCVWIQMNARFSVLLKKIRKMPLSPAVLLKVSYLVAP